MAEIYENKSEGLVSDGTVAVEGQCVEQRPVVERVLRLIVLVFPFLALIYGIHLFWGRGVGWTEIGLLLLMYAVSGIGVTIGLHRYFTHKSFQTAGAIKYLLGVFGSMAAEDPLFMWVAVHRRHHQFSDRQGDPHSPHVHGDDDHGMIKGLYHAQVGWFFSPRNRDLMRYVPDLRREPVLVFIDKAFLLWVGIGLIIPGLLGGLISGSWRGAMLGFLWGGLVRMFIVHHITWSINSVCHTWGSRPFKNRDHSTNNLPCALLSFGEGWHNNHHAFPTSARHGFRWWELDPTWWLIWVMGKVGLAWEIRLPSKESVESRRRP